jgi:LysM repeat protein
MEQVQHLYRLFVTHPLFWRQVAGRAWWALLGVGLFCLAALFGFSPPVVAQQADNTIHVVRYGETLSEIAQSYRVAMAVVMDQNGINDPDSIYVGQPLQIPVVESTAESSESLGSPAIEAAPASPNPVRITSLNRMYTVRSGDTLPWIALRLGLDLAALRAINNLDSGQAISVGQQLILPATEDELRVTPTLLHHTVRIGESLGLIAQSHNTSLSALMAINRITNPDLIQPGQELVIPNPDQAEQAPIVGPARSGFYYHDVRPGETLSQLAAQYNTTPQAIVRYNNLPNIETIFSGLEVRIPFGPPVLNRQTPQAPRSGTEFVISISRQRCWVFQGDRIRYEWKCSTGQGEWVTRTGTFYVKTKMDMAQSRAYQLDMPYWLGLYDVGSYENGIHGIPIDWRTGERLWDNLVGQPATFGCAMLLDEDAAILFDLAYIGMPIHIVD